MRFEERDLTEYYGQAYATYRTRVPMLFTRPGGRPIASEPEAAVTA